MPLPNTRFTAKLIEANRLDPRDFQCWVFCPGMLFNAPDKWWGDHGRRDFPHEGIDFCLYRDRSGQVLRLDHNTCIPAMHDGCVRALFSDYLGQAVVIEHENAPSGGGRTIAVYAHTKPRDNIQPGVVVKEGEIIATIAGTGRSNAKILPHLHFSLGQPSPDIVYQPFVWNQMRDPGQVTLLNPQSVIDWPCEVLDPHASDCRMHSSGFKKTD